MDRYSYESKFPLNILGNQLLGHMEKEEYGKKKQTVSLSSILPLRSLLGSN